MFSVVVLLTSLDKSMIYQALPCNWLSVYLGQRTSPIVIVIVLLVAIMKHQVVLIKRKGINATFIGEEPQDQQVISTIRSGHTTSLYIVVQLHTLPWTTGSNALVWILY